MIPRRAYEALKRDELSLAQFSIIAFLCAEADYETGVATLTLRALKDGMRWKQSPDWLLKNLRSLRASGWVSYESRDGQQTPYVIKLTGAAVLRDSTKEQISEPEVPSRSEVTSERDAHGISPESNRDATEKRSKPQSTSDPKKEQKEKEQRRVALEELLGSHRCFDSLTVSQREEATIAWEEDPDRVRSCVSDAVKGKSPAGLFLHLLRNRPRGGAPKVGSPGAYAVHLYLPDQDSAVFLGPFESHEEARAEAERHPEGDPVFERIGRKR